VTFEEARQKAVSYELLLASSPVPLPMFRKPKDTSVFPFLNATGLWRPGDVETSTDPRAWQYTEGDIDALHKEIAELRLAITQLKAENHRLSSKTVPLT
jgi:hypothetical protein